MQHPGTPPDPYNLAPSPDEALLSTAQAARFAGISARTLREEVLKGHIAVTEVVEKHRKRFRFAAADVARYIDTMSDFAPRPALPDGRRMGGRRSRIHPKHQTALTPTTLSALPPTYADPYAATAELLETIGEHVSPNAQAVLTPLPAPMALALTAILNRLAYTTDELGAQATAITRLEDTVRRLEQLLERQAKHEEAPAPSQSGRKPTPIMQLHKNRSNAGGELRPASAT